MKFDQRFPEHRVLITGANSGFGEGDLDVVRAARVARVVTDDVRCRHVAAQRCASRRQEVLELTIEVGCRSTSRGGCGRSGVWLDAGQQRRHSRWVPGGYAGALASRDRYQSFGDPV
jgi:hypothetical protein